MLWDIFILTHLPIKSFESRHSSAQVAVNRDIRLIAHVLLRENIIHTIINSLWQPCTTTKYYSSCKNMQEKKYADSNFKVFSSYSLFESPTVFTAGVQKLLYLLPSVFSSPPSSFLDLIPTIASRHSTNSSKITSFVYLIVNCVCCDNNIVYEDYLYIYVINI